MCSGKMVPDSSIQLDRSTARVQIRVRKASVPVWFPR